MTVLRSKRQFSDTIQPSTPAQTQESSAHHSPVEPALDRSSPVDGPTNTFRRRSPRLAYQCDDDESLDGFTAKEVSISVCSKRNSNGCERFLSLRSGKRVAKRCVANGCVYAENEISRSGRFEIDSGKLDLEIESDLDLRNNGKKVCTSDDSKERKSASGSKRQRVCVDLVEENHILSKKSDNSGDDRDHILSKKSDNSGDDGDHLGDTVRRMVNEKGKTVMAEVLLVESKNKGKRIVEDPCQDNNLEVKCDESCENPSSSIGRRKYTREEKGKGIQVENVSPPITNEITRVDLEEMEIHNSVINQKPPEASGTELSVPVNAEQTQNHNGGEIGNASRNQQFRDIAEKNASRFARFDAEKEEEEEFSDTEVEPQVEDWPGPFSTAMKIIKDQEENTILRNGFPFSDKERSLPIIWSPRRNYSFAPPRAPSLQELSLQILVKNAEAITSLDYVPDVLRVKLCQLLCDSRRMDVHFLDLLVRGSPTGICVPDCSWLTEEQFTDCFKNCDTSNLMVLQLDQCGRCMPDYVLTSTLARSQKNLPMLSSLSLSGAYRLSDVGLRALVSVAPAIRSINLSQCSLLTSSSIDMLSDSLGSVLRELYLNECQSIDLKMMLSALKKFEKLEVLSLVDLPSVRGRFLREFVTTRGHSLKQLILTNSVKLTDTCVKDISENCPNLSVLDLANVCKLTDSALGYLANGCQALEKLIFCRNSFSDEAVAAFVETAGGSLMELSLNNVKKVGHNTALALAKLSEKLQILDVSWCRDISDHSLGYIVDNCSSLNVLKVFGCTQITDVFVRGHSNPNVKILGLKMDPFLNLCR